MVFRLPEGGPVRVRTSTQSGDAPTASELEEGEISLNAADGVLYYQTAAGSIGTAGPPDAPSDGGTYARKDGNWIDIEEAANLQVNRGTAAEVAAYTPLAGEPVWEETTKSLFVGDGTTQGGILVGRRVLASAPINSAAITSSTYSTPVSLTLTGNGSRWRVYGTLSFSGIDENDADIQINLAGSAGTVLRGAVWISAPAGTSYKNHLSGAVTISVDELETAQVDFDYVVLLAASSISFGLPIRRTSGTEAAYIIDDASGYSRMFAERIG